MGRVVVFTFVAATVVFCVVQDRVTAAGVREYVSLQREAMAGRGPAVRIEDVMGPARRRSVREGLRWSGAVAWMGVAAAIVIRNRRRG